MTGNSSRFLKVGVRAAAVLGGLTLASCAPQYSAPREVHASDPSVTYTYSTDQGLLQVDRSAATYCSRYQSVAKAASFTTDQSGSKVVVFQCVPATTTTAAMAPQPNPDLTYNYESDQQLMDNFEKRAELLREHGLAAGDVEYRCQSGWNAHRDLPVRPAITRDRAPLERVHPE